MSDDDDLPTMEEALEQLRENHGQTYLLANEAAKLLAPFATKAEPEWVAENTHLSVEEAEEVTNANNARTAFCERVADEMRAARDARGMVSVGPHRTILGYDDVSGILVEALGGEPSDYTAVGAGFTADGRHDENLDTIDDLLDAPAAEQ